MSGKKAKQARRAGKTLPTYPPKMANAELPNAPPMLLSAEALADLKYIEPIRARDRLMACLNEIYLGLIQLQQAHGPADH